MRKLTLLFFCLYMQISFGLPRESSPIEQEKEFLIRALELESDGNNDSLNQWIANHSTSQEIPTENLTPEVISRLQLTNFPVQVISAQNGFIYSDSNQHTFSFLIKPQILHKKLSNRPLKPLYHGGKHTLFINPTNEIVILTQEQEILHPLPSPFVRLIPLEENAYLIITKFHILRLDNYQIQWVRESQHFSTCQVFHTGEQVFMGNCEDSSLKQIVTASGEELNLWNWNNRILNLKKIGDFLLIQEQMMMHLANISTGKVLWSRKIEGKTDIHWWDGSLLIQTKQRILQLNPINGKVLKSRPNSAKFLLFDNENRPTLFKENGLVQKLDHNLNVISQYHSGEKIPFEPLLIDSTFLFVDAKGMVTQLNASANTQEESIRNKLKARLQQECQNQKTSTNCRWLIDSLYYLEPGSPELAFQQFVFHKDPTQRLAFLTKSLAGYQNYLNPPQQVLDSLSSLLQLEWTLPLPKGSRFFPDFFSLNGSQKAVFIGPDERSLYSLELKTGKIDTLLLFQDEKLKLFEFQQDLFLTLKNQVFLLKESPVKLTETAFNIKNMYESEGQWTFTGTFGEWELRNKNFNSPVLWQNILPPRTLYQGVYKNKTLSISSSGNIHRFEYNAQGVSSEMEFLGSSINQVLQKDSTFIFSLTSSQIVNRSANSSRNLWTKSYPIPIFSLTNLDKNHFIVGNQSQQLEVFTFEQGQKTWSYQGKNSLLIKPFIHKEHIFIDQGNELVILDKRTGSVVFNKTFPFEIGRPQVLRNLILIPSRNGYLMALKLDSLRL